MLKLIEKLFQASSFKAAIFILCGAAWQFIAPIGDFIFLIAVLLVVDLLTGIMAANKRGEAITSSGWRRTIVKLSSYAISIIVTQYVKVVFFSEININIAYSVALFIAATEVKSIHENIFCITGIDIFKYVLAKILTK